MSEAKKRFIPLDILRGLAMAFMIIVNNPGGENVYSPLKHSAWNGCTPTDIVFPVFLFCVGLAMAWSLSKFDRLNGKAAKKILRRGILIFLIGLILNYLPSLDLKQLRWFGVLQRIACCYVLCAIMILLLKKDSWILTASLLLLAIYSAVQVFAGEPGLQFSLEGNVCGKIDMAICGKAHMYKNYSVPLDPCGPFGTISAMVNVLLGYLVGRHIRKEDFSISEITVEILVYGLLSLAFAEVVAIWIPINKALWTASYVLLTNGWAMILLGVIMYLTDIKVHVKVFEPARVFGMNALTAYILAGLLSTAVSMSGIRHDLALSTPLLSLLYSLCFMFLLYLVCLVLYKKKIFIKL